MSKTAQMETRAGAFEIELDPRRPGVEGVLDHLLHHRRWPLHHLPGGDLRNEAVVEDPDAGHGDSLSGTDSLTAPDSQEPAERST